MASPRLTGWAIADPPIALEQSAARELARRIFAPMPGVERLLPLFERAGVASRRIVVPLERLLADSSPSRRNADYVTHSLALLTEAGRAALVRAGVTPSSITHVLLVSSTGLANPTLDVRLADALELPTTVRRVPLWGLGCGGGAQGLALAADLARSRPQARVLLLAVELCSLTLVPGDLSPGNLVATALFGDGAAAAVIEGDSDAAGIELVDAQAERIPDTLDVMGWTIADDGWRVVFSPEIPGLVREHAPRATRALLARHGLAIGDVRHHVLHPGGPAILDAYQEALALPVGATAHARAALREHGNCSSVSIFQVLERAIGAGAEEGPVLFSSFGPGFSAEVLLGRLGPAI